MVYLKTGSYDNFMDFLVPQIMPGAEYRAKVVFEKGREMITGEIEDCIQKAKVYKNDRVIAELEIKHIRYDNLEEYEEDEKLSLEQFLHNLEIEVRETFPNGIKRLPRGRFRLKKPLYQDGKHNLY